MDVDRSLALLGGLSPARFMRRHWQKKPLLVRQAWPGAVPPLTRAQLFALAARDGVESRLVARDASGRWSLRQGPLPRRAMPPLARKNWTLLVQGLDLHLDGARAMLEPFRFVPEARLDDLMISYASDGGGVGPHLDSYDVFLLQVHGRRRWRIGPARDRSLRPGLPVKILADFRPDEEWILEPGDLLYLPPLWGHEGTAVGGDCMTCSVGFRAASAGEVARELLPALADEFDGHAAEAIYRDRAQAATVTPGAVPPSLRDFAARALHDALANPAALDRALGSWLTEPKPRVWFEPGESLPADGCGVVLDRRTRMMYDQAHVYINGEALHAGGRDARIMRGLADARRLGRLEQARLSEQARAQLDEWAQAGWLHAE